MIGEVLFGMLLYPILKGYRSLNSNGWDRSNATNFIRTESYTTLYPDNLAQMYFLTDEQVQCLEDAGHLDLVKPFDYISGDEFSDHFPYTRPDK